MEYKMAVVLTKEIIESLTTPRGGFTQATLEALGVPWPPRLPWKQGLIGTVISDEKFAAARAGMTSRKDYKRMVADKAQAKLFA
jgi:hypothetical protein